MLSFLNWIKRNVGRYVVYMFLSTTRNLMFRVNLCILDAKMLEFACLTG